MSRAGELFSLRAAPQWGHCSSCFKVLGIKCAVLPAPPWELWGFSHPFWMVLVLSFFVFVTVPPFSSLTLRLGGESEPTHIHFHGLNVLCHFQKLLFPLAVPHLPLGKKHLGNDTNNVPSTCSCGGCASVGLFWCSCPGAVWVFPRNAELAFRLRDTNVTPCHAGLWVLFLGHSGVAFIFRLQQFMECLFHWIMQKSIPLSAVLTD